MRCCNCQNYLCCWRVCTLQYPTSFPVAKKFHGAYIHARVSVQCTCSNIEATALQGCFVTMLSLFRHCKGTFLNSSVFKALFSHMKCVGSGRAIASSLTTGRCAPSDAPSVAPFGASSGAPSVALSNETLAGTALRESSNDARFRYYGHTCRTPSRALFSTSHKPMLIIGWRQRNCELVIHMGRFVVSQKIGRPHGKETLIYQWQLLIFVNTTTGSHPAPNGSVVTSSAALPFPIFSGHQDTHAHFANLNTVATRVLHRSRICDHKPQQRTELHGRERRVADWHLESMRISRSHGNEPIQNQRIHQEAPPMVLKRMRVPPKMHHQVSLQTKLPLNFPVPCPKTHENPLLSKKKCPKNSFCGSAQKRKRDLGSGYRTPLQPLSLISYPNTGKPTILLH